MRNGQRLCLLIMLLLVLAACGGGDDPTEAADLPTEPPTIAPATESTQEAAADPSSTPTELPETTPESTPETTADAGNQQQAVETTVDDAACAVLVEEVLTAVDEACNITGRNEICYGNLALSYTLQTDTDATQLAFDTPGDIIPVTEIQSIQLSALNVAEEIWGVALMRVQTDIENTMPGQSVTFLLFGDVQLENRGEETTLNSFYFQSGIGDAPCAAAPDSGILIQTPEGIGEISFQANGVDVSLGSTAFLQAQPGRELAINVVEGQAEVESNGVSRTVEAGNRTTVALDANGDAQGEPSPPVPYTQVNVQAVALPVSSVLEPVTIIEGAQVDDRGIQVGDVVSEAIVAPGVVKTYRFILSDASDVYFAAQGYTGAGIFWQLEDADGNIVFPYRQMWFGNDAIYELQADVEYALQVAGENGATGEYQFETWVIPEAQTFAYDIGTRIDAGAAGEGSGALEQRGAQDIYTFTVDNDQPIYFAALGEGEDANIFWSLKDDDFAPIFEDQQLWFGNDPGEFTLNAGETYTITVFGEGNSVGEYAFQLWAIPEPQAFTIDVGALVSMNDPAEGAGNIEQPGAQDIYTFTLDAAQELYFAALGEDDGNIQWHLEDANGAFIFDDDRLWAGNDPGVYQLEAGTYTIVVSGMSGSTGGYSFEIRSVAEGESASLETLEATIEGSITTSGQEDTYALNAQAGQRVYLQSLDSDTTLRWSIINATGTEIADMRADFDLGRVEFEDDGVYTLVVGSPTGDTGDYNFQIWDVPADSVRSIAVSSSDTDDADALISGETTIPGEIHRFPFSVEPNQRVYFDSQDSTRNLRWEIVDSSGIRIAETRADIDIGRIDFIEADSYQVVIYDNDDGTGAYEFRLWTVPEDAEFFAEVGDSDPESETGVYSGEILTPGEVDRFVFTVAPGAIVYIDSTDSTRNLRWRVEDGEGEQVAETRADIDIGRVEFAEGGSYTLVFSDNDDGTGAYEFRLWTVPEDAEFIAEVGDSDLESETGVYSGEILTPGTTHRYIFEVEGGDIIYIDSQDSTRNLRWRVEDDEGEQVAETRADIDIGRVEFAEGGSYTLVFSDNDDGTGAYQFRLWTVPQDSTTDLTFDEPIVGETITPGEIHRYVFSVDAGDVVGFRARESSRSLRWRIVDAEGEVIANNRADIDIEALEFAVAGTYTVEIFNQTGDVGTYSFVARRQ